MSVATTPYIATRTPLGPDGLLAYARTICGVRVGTECLSPNVEADACYLFRRLAERLEAMTRKPAFSREVAEEYHLERAGSVLVTTPRERTRRDAPPVTLDAVIYSARELGFAAAMADKANRERIRSMSQPQHKELTERLQKLVDEGAIRP